LEPEKLTHLKYIGVDEVARAKGYDYMTVIYDMVEGHLIGVETGSKFYACPFIFPFMFCFMFMSYVHKNRPFDFNSIA